MSNVLCIFPNFALLINIIKRASVIVLKLFLTYLLNGETEDVLHVGGQLTVKYPDAPIVADANHHDGPHWQAGEHVPPRQTMISLPAAVPSGHAAGLHRPLDVL